MSLLNDIEMEKTTNTVVSDNSNSVISVLGDATMDLKEIPASQVVEPVPVANKKRRQGLMDITELSPELLSAYKIVTQLMSVSNKNVNYAFMNPINYSEPENENYTEVIKKPMWLNKVKLKLLSGRYNSISQVVRDLRLVLENCYRFYGPAHTITKKAIKLETMLEQKLALLPRELKEKTSLQLTTPELVNKVENNVKATNSKTAPKLGSHKDETSMILNCVRQARAKQEREARRLQMEEKRAERDSTNQELAQWEESFYGNELTDVKKMWELPQIGHFLYLVQTVLNIPEVSQFELERSLLKPQCSSLLASIMTSLLSSPHQRAKLDEIPAMTYKIWQSRLKMKVQAWYRVFNYRAKSPVKVFEATGVEPTFFSVMGHENPLDSKEFHELNLKQRVWLVKSMCDHCLQNHKTIQDAISESSLLDQKEYALGNDRDESTYIHFPQFCGQSLRVYKQYFDAGEAPDLEFPLLLEEVKNEICENNSEEESEQDVKVKKLTPGKKTTVVIKKEEKEATPKKRKGRKTTAWSSRRRKTRKKIVEDEPEEEEDVKPNIIPFFELVVDNIESLRKLTAKFSSKDGKEDETATTTAPATTTSAPDTPSSSRTSPSPTPSPIPDEIISAMPNSRSSRRSKLLATIALKKGSSTPEAKKERKKEIKEESEEEEKSETGPPENSDEKNLCKRLVNLLKELEPWEQKLDQADRKIRFKLKKEWEDYQTKVISPEAEAANEYWGAHVADEFTALAAAAKLEDQVSSSSDDESFYINAEKELAEANQAAKGGNEETLAADGSQFRKTHYRRCTKRQKVDRNVVTGPISSSEEQEPESDESSGSASSFHISVSSRGRIRKTKKLGFSFENQNEKTTKNESKEVKEVVNKPNGLVVVLDNQKRDLDNDAKSQYQWETMRQLIVDNSPKEIMTPLVPKLKIFKAKTSTTEDASPQNQPILENLLASQPGFGEMRPKTQTNQASSTDTAGKLPDEPKYLQSFIQKHYQAPTQPKPLTFFRKDTNTVESPTKTVVIRQSKDGGTKVIETSFAKHGTMKTTVSTTNQEVVVAKKSKPGPKPRQRQTCYANANAPVTTTLANTKVAANSTFVTNVYKPGATQTDPINNQLENKTATPGTTQMRVVVPQPQIRMLNQQPQQVIYRNQVPQQVIYRPQQGNQTFRGQLVNSGPQRGNQQVLYRLEQPNPNAVQPNVPGPQENKSQQVLYRLPQTGHAEMQQNIQGNQSPQVIYRPPQPQGNPGPQRVIQRNTEVQQVIQRNPGPTRPQQVIQRNPASQPVYVQQQGNPGPGKVMPRNPNSQQLMTRNSNPHQAMIRNPNEQQVMQRNPNPQQVMIRNPNAQQGIQRNPNPQQIMIRNPNAPQVMIRNPNAQQVMQINSNPQQVMQRNLNPQQVLQGNQNPQLVMPGQVSQQVIFKSHPTNPSPTPGTYRPQPQGSPQQITYRAPPPNPGPSQVILRPQHRVPMPQPANTRPQYTIAAPQQSNTQHQYRPQTQEQSNFNPHTPQLANYNPQGSQPGTFASPPTQQTNYHPQANFGPPVSQQGHFGSQPAQQSNFNPQTTLQTNYHPQGNFNPQAPQRGNYHPQASQQGNFNPQSPQQGNFNPQSPQQGNFNPQSPQQGNFTSQVPQQGNYNPQTPQQGNYNPPTPQQGNYNPPTPQPAIYNPSAPQPANYNPPAPQQSNYNPPAPQQGNYNTPAAQQGNYNPPTPQPGNYNTPTPQPGNYNSSSTPQPGNYPPTPQPGNFNPPPPQQGNFNPPAPQKGNYNPQTPQQGNYNPPAPQQGNYNPQVVQQASFNPQGVMYGTQQANYNPQTPPVYHQVSRPSVPMQQQGMVTNQEAPEPAREVINQGVPNQIYKVAQAAEGSNSPQQATNSATTRRVMIMPIKGNLPAGQKGPLVFKLVSRNSPNTTNVQSVSNAGSVTYAKLVKSSNPGTGTSFVIKQNSNVRGPAPSNSPVVQTPPPASPNQIASQASNAFLNQTSAQSGQFYQPPPSPRVQYAGAVASPNSPVLSNAQHQIALNNANQDPRLNRVMMSNNGVEESLNQQSMVNVQSPANNVVVQCPVQLQTANPVQYVTTTAASSVMSQTNQRVLVCSPNPTFENNPNSTTDNVYFLTNSGQLVAFNKNSTPGGAATSIPTSVPHPTITNDNLQNL